MCMSSLDEKNRAMTRTLVFDILTAIAWSSKRSKSASGPKIIILLAGYNELITILKSLPCCFHIILVFSLEGDPENDDDGICPSQG